MLLNNRIINEPILVNRLLFGLTNHRIPPQTPSPVRWREAFVDTQHPANEMTTQDQYHELSFYTLAHKGKNFVHQHIVDAYAAQTADTDTKPITIFFSLAGLYLFVEKGFTGRQVQDAHLQMAQKPKEYPKIILPEHRGKITVKNVLDAPAGADRDAMILEWCISVWTAFSDQHEKVIFLTEKLLAK